MAAPKYISLAAELRKEVLSGRYGIEGGMPAVRDLARKYGVVVNTVQAALHRLEGEGLLVKRGQGFYVNRVKHIMTQYVPLPTVRLDPYKGYVKTLQASRVRLPEHIAQKINIPPDGEPVPTRSQVSGEVNGEEHPLQLTIRYYFLHLSDEQISRLEKDAEWDPMWDVIGFLDGADESAPRLATAQETEWLKLPEGTPVNDVWEVIRDGNGSLLMAQELTLTPRATLVWRYRFENRPS